MAVYLVTTPAGDHLVEAKNQTAAIRAVVWQNVEVRPITASELLAYMQAGQSVQTATQETDQALTSEAA